MVIHDGRVRVSYEELEALFHEQETLVDALREQVQVLERERDEVRQGLDVLTDAMRRRGCCDHDADGHPL